MTLRTIFYRLFGHALCKVMFVLSRVYLPMPIRLKVLNAFLRISKADPSEALLPLHAYSTLNAFFTRALKADVHRIESTPCVSPVDGTVLELGSIQENTLIQAKGVGYTLDGLIGKKMDSFQNGSFVTIYLSPKDCHRIFSPVDGQIVGSRFLPGQILPVREPFISDYSDLYTQNERVVIDIKATTGAHYLLVLVGAVNVGTIETQWDKTVYRPHWNGRVEKTLYTPIPIQKGEWIATFHLGSTIVLACDRPLSWLRSKGPIRVGNGLAS